MDKLALAAVGRDERLSVTVDCGGCEEYIGNDVIYSAVEELDATPAPLAWSSERPKAAGVYWFRRREGAEPMIIKIDIREIESNWMWAERFQVAGPIPEPMEPPS